jgi:hypothetical protein
MLTAESDKRMETFEVGLILDTCVANCYTMNLSRNFTVTVSYVSFATFYLFLQIKIYKENVSCEHRYTETVYFVRHD